MTTKARKPITEADAEPEITVGQIAVTPPGFDDCAAVVGDIVEEHELTVRAKKDGQNSQGQEENEDNDDDDDDGRKVVGK